MRSQRGSRLESVFVPRHGRRLPSALSLLAISVCILVAALLFGVAAAPPAQAVDAGHISGTVTNAGHDPLPNISVNVYASLNDYYNWNQLANQWTNADGTYDLGGLPVGSYLVEFRDDNKGDYLTQYYKGQLTADQATLVPVTVGHTTPGIDAVLTVAGHISGTVTKAGGVGLNNISVNAYASLDDYNNGQQVANTGTNPDGTYDLGGLPNSPTGYIVEFADWNNGDYIMQYYKGQLTADQATLVPVTVGHTTPGIDAVLTVAGHISGTVTKAGGVGLNNISVNAYASLDDYNNGQQVANTGTNADGTYDLGGLPASPTGYIVEFADWNNGDYIMQYYKGQLTADQATLVPVTIGTPETGIDAVLAVAGHISGTVTKAGGVGLNNISVNAYASLDDYNNGQQVANTGTGTNADGTYDLGGLPASPTGYIVEFADWNNGDYFTQYYDNTPIARWATLVPVTIGTPETGIDAVLISTAVPTVTGFTPTSGPVGTSVTLTGTGFLDATGVRFHGTASWAACAVVSDTQITATVLAGATTGTITVAAPGGTGESATSFTVTPTPTPTPIPTPAVTSFTPTSGLVGTAVTLTGTGFTGATKVAFHGTSAATFSVNSATKMTATVPSGATTGPIAVTTPGGSAASAASFTVVFRPKVTLKLSGLTSGAIRLGRRVTAKGTVTPTRLAGSKVKLTVQKKRGARWVTVKRVARTISASGAYSWKYKPVRKGAYRMRATIAKTVAHTAAKTKWRPFRVK